MRRAHASVLPALTQFFGLKPWDLDRMTQREISAYQAWMLARVSEANGGL